MTISIPDPAAAAAWGETLARAGAERWAARLATRDTTLWTTDLAVAADIGDRLGWLDAPGHFSVMIPALEQFGEAIRDAGFTAAIVAGMGGSSLAPEVVARVFGTTEDWLEVRILDSTDPAAVAAVVDDLDPLTTLFIIASKSGTTAEVHAFAEDAWHRIQAAIDRSEHRFRHAGPGDFMIGITDPGKPEHALPHRRDLREVWLNPEDIGGRYAALTYVGLVPASLIGIDLDPLLGSAVAMLERCGEPDPEENPGIALGTALATLAAAGRDKLTLVADAEIEPFGAWVEQLVAESTGKRGVGIVPIDREPIGAAEAYGADRVFVRLSLTDGTPPTARDGTTADALTAALEALGHPVVRIAIEDPMDLGGEFVRWEVATAIAGAVLGIDPFDQPDVEAAKVQARALLEEHDAPLEPPVGWEGELAGHLARIGPRSYLAIQAFIAPTPERDAAIARIRARLRDATGRATTAGYGPRFLHSTGQLHKGGAPIGWFLQLTADHPVDRPIPGLPYTFGRLVDAQAQGDRAVIAERGLPILRVHLGLDPDAGLAALERALETTLAAPSTGG